jgi:hypothetical protein
VKPPSGHDVEHIGVMPTMQHEVLPVHVCPPQKPPELDMSETDPPPPPPVPPPPAPPLPPAISEAVPLGVLEPHAATKVRSSAKMVFVLVIGRSK